MDNGKYIWRRKDGDYPIEVVGSWGIVDGVEYLKIKGSNTGIPSHECVKEGEENESV